MATLTVYGDEADGYIQSEDATYLTARAGGGVLSVNTSSGTIPFQHWGPFDRTRLPYIAFDTSPLGVTATISAAELSLYDASQNAASAYQLNVRLYDWGATLETADFIPGADMAANTLLAHLASASRIANDWNTFVDDALPANVNKTGFTRMVLSSNLFEAGTEPVGTESWTFSSANEVDISQDPKLVITYTAGGGGSSRVMALLGVG